MTDQAERLRLLVKNANLPKTAKVVSIVSGKGGVGKTNVSVNLAVGLSQIGKKVLLIDLDIGMANADIIAGVSVNYTIVDMIEKKISIHDIMCQGPENIYLIAGGSGLARLFDMDPIKFSYFISQLEELEHRFDYIFFDMGAGLTKDSLEFILASHETILIMTPEPTSITDGYGLMKTLHKKGEGIPFFMIINCCESEQEGYDTAMRFKRATREFLQTEVQMIGVLPFDRAVTKAVKDQIPFLLSAPKSKVSRSMKKIVLTYSGQSEQTSEKPYQHFLSKLTKLFSPR